MRSWGRGLVVSGGLPPVLLLAGCMTIELGSPIGAVAVDPIDGLPYCGEPPVREESLPAMNLKYLDVQKLIKEALSTSEYEAGETTALRDATLILHPPTKMAIEGRPCPFPSSQAGEAR